MPTIAREIDALGGAMPTGNPYWEGYSDALTAANDIAESADALVEGLLEALEDVLDGRRPLDLWTADVRALVCHIKRKRSE